MQKKLDAIINRFVPESLKPAIDNTYQAIGNRREQQDTLVAYGNHIYIVADGMGGYLNGAQASQIVCNQTVLEYFKSGPSGAFFRQPTVPEILVNTSALLIKERSGSGSTALVCLRDYVDPNKFELFWVGDSSAYLVDNQGFKKLTKPDRGDQPDVLTNYIGKDGLQEQDVHSLIVIIGPSESLLLTTDGLSDSLDGHAFGLHPPDVTRIVKQNPRTSAEKLVEAAVRVDGDDNTSCIVIPYTKP